MLWTRKSMCCTYQLAVLPKARLDKQEGSQGNIFHAIRFLKPIIEFDAEKRKL